MRRNKVIWVIALTLLLTFALGSVSVSASSSNTKIDLEKANLIEPAEGFVNTNQNANGDLRIVVSLKDAAPNTTYRLDLFSNPAHGGGAYWNPGTITTNKQGNANSGAILIPLSDLESQLLPGSYTGHVDIVDPTVNANLSFTADMVPIMIP